MASLPMTNVSIMNVRNCLAYPSTDLGTLCSCNKINKWAKYKPVRYNFTYNRPSDWWKAGDNSCGFDLTSAKLSNSADYDGMINKTWNYLQPRGGESEPFRLGDFCGYNPDARVQYVCMPPPNAEQQRELVIPFQEEYVENSLTLLDLEERIGVSGLHIGCALKYNNYVQYGSTSLTGGGNKSITIRLGANIPANALCDLYIFLANQGVSGSQFPSNTLFYAYPDGKGISRHFQIYINPITTVVDSYEITNWNYVETNFNYIKYEATVKRTDGMPIAFDNRNFRFSYTLTTEYGETIRENRYAPTTSERPTIDLPSSTSTTCTISGIIYLDNNIIQNWQGTFVIEYYIYNNGDRYDSLGGVRVSYP